MELWAYKVDILKVLRYADHVVIDVSEAYNADAEFIGVPAALDTRRALKVPPCFRLRYGKDEDRVSMEKEMEVEVELYGKAIRPCRFCDKISRNRGDLARFLKCFQPEPMPPKLPMEVTGGWIDEAKLEELLKERKAVKNRKNGKKRRMVLRR